MKTFNQYISEIAKGIYKGFGMLIIDGQKVDVEVELYGTDNKNNTFLTRIVDIDKKYQKTHPIGKEVAIPAKTFRRGRWVKVKTSNAFEAVSFQTITVKDKSGKSHTQGAVRIRPDTTHVAIMHYDAIAGTNLSTGMKAHTSLNFGTEKSLDKVISHAKKKFNLKKAEIQKLDKKYL